MIYFVRDTLSGSIKIGHSVSPWTRLAQIQVHCVGEVVLLAMEPGGPEREAELHATFADARQRGEWFAPAPEIIAHISGLEPAKRPSVIRDYWGGMSAKEVSKAAGISGPMLSQIRTGGRRPSPEAAFRLQEITGRSAIELVFGPLADRVR